MMPSIIWTAPTQVFDAAVGHQQKRWRGSQRRDLGRSGTLQDDPDDLDMKRNENYCVFHVRLLRHTVAHFLNTLIYVRYENQRTEYN